MKLLTLGGLRLAGAEFARAKPLLLLTYLALEGARDRHHLVELFWQGAADPLNSLAAALKQLRQGVAASVEADQRQVWTTIDCDAVIFLHDVEVGHYDEAAATYKGPFLEGVYLPGWGVELEEWVYGTREFLAGRARETLVRLGERAASRGDFAQAGKLAEAAYLLTGTPELEPEDVARLHTLLAAGDSAHLVKLHKEAQTLGLELSTSPKNVWERLQEPNAAAARPALPARLRAFVGRDAERAEVTALLARPDCSLLTLSGPGGVGKSCLALEAAHDLVARYADGVCFVPLDALTSVAQLPASIATALSLKFQGGEDPAAQLARQLQTKAVLVVLDNFEHLIKGSALLSGLLQACPGLNLLVTSRERLNLEREWVMLLEGLAVPAPEVSLTEARRFDAVQLFVERAKRSQLDYELTPATLPHVVAMCRNLQGLPLGIELAAAWVKVLSSEAISEEMTHLDFFASLSRDVSVRHKSMRAVFESSWRRLSSQEQRVLRNLSVFSGGFTRSAAAEVAGATLPVLASLVDKSLLRVSPGGRYDAHPLLYQFAQEQLAGHPEERQTQANHADYYLRFLQRRTVDMKGERQTVGLARMTEELANIRAAWQWAVAGARFEALQQAVEPLTLFYDMQAHYAEGIDLFKQASAVLSETNPRHRLALGNLWVGEAFLQQWSSNYGEAVSKARRGLSLLRPLGDSWGLMLGLDALGFTAVFTAGDYAEGKRCWTEALNVARAQTEHLKTAELLSIVGMAECWLNRQAEAEAYLAEAMILTRRLGKHTTVIYVLLNLGFIHVWSDPEKALPAFRQGLELANELDYRRYLPYLLYGQGWALCTLEQYPAAQALCHQAVDVARQSGDLFAQAVASAILGRSSAGLRDFSAAQTHLQQSLQLSQIIHSVFSTLVTLAYVADLWLEQSPTKQVAERAAELLGLTLHHPAAIQHAKEVAERALQKLPGHLSPKVLAAALERGKHMSIEGVVEAVLYQLGEHRQEGAH